MDLYTVHLLIVDSLYGRVSISKQAKQQIIIIVIINNSNYLYVLICYMSVYKQLNLPQWNTPNVYLMLPLPN